MLYIGYLYNPDNSGSVVVSAVYGTADTGVTAILCSVLGKLFLVPAVGYMIAAYMGYRNVELLSLGAMFMSPVASSSYNMAEAMGGNGELAGAVVVSTSVVSVVSIFLWIFLMSNIGMIAVVIIPLSAYL